jgi:folate-binding protein YgfZ
VASLFETVTGKRAALRDLCDRGLVRVTGADRVRFLNGMLSNDVAKLAAGSACASLLLDRKGHVLAELFVLAEPDSILLDVAPGAEAELSGVLEKHIIADDVVLASESGESGQLGLEGPGARDAAQALGFSALEPARFARVEFSGETLLVLAGGSLGHDGLRVIARRGPLARLRKALGLPELSAEQVEVLRIEAAIPKLGVDVSARHFPQEARLEHAFSLAKGCYVGQEIVARIASRGAVNRLLVKLRTRAPVAPGAEIRVADTVSGQVTSSAVSAASGPISLGYVRVADARAGVAVSVGGIAGEIVDDYSRR